MMNPAVFRELLVNLASRYECCTGHIKRDSLSCNEGV